MPSNQQQPRAESPPAGVANDQGQRPELTLQQRRALTLRKVVLPSIANGALNMQDHVDAPTVAAYLDDFAERAGDPTDPVEQAMVRQLAQSDLVIGQLLMAANIAKTPQAASAYGGLGCRLLGEFRKLAISLKDYREDNQQRRTTVVHQVTHVGQQNIAEQQHVNYRQDKSNEGGVSMNCSDTELGLNAATKDQNHEHDRFQFDEETPAQPCPEREPQAQEIHG